MKLSLMRMLAGALAALGVVCAGPAMASIQYNSNNSTTGFDATTTGSSPTGFTSATGTWKALTTGVPVPSHTKVLGDSSQTNNALAVYTGGTLSGDLEVTSTQSITLVSNSATTEGLGVRYNSAGNTGYACAPSVGSGQANVQLFKQISGTFTAFTGGGLANNVYAPASGSYMSVRMSIVGTTISCKIWDSGSAEPAGWTVQVTDSSVTGTGYAAITNGQTVAGQQGGITDFTVNDVPKGETNAISITTPAPLAVGATVSGVYTGTAPTGLGIAFDGATSFTAISSPTIGGGTFSFALPSSTVAYHQIAIQASNLTTETSATPAFRINSLGSLTIAPNNAAIFYSPYNWTAPTSSAASSINPGAYFKVLFTGAQLILNFNTTNNSAPLSQIYYRIDGYETQSPWTAAAVAGTVTVTLPTNIAAGNGNLYHLLEVMVKSTSETINRWNSPSNTAVVFSGMQVAAGATVLAPQTYPKRCLFYGDSRMEGVRTVNQTATNDTDRNDALAEWPWQVGNRLNCEFGVVGFGGQGVTITGSGNVPPLPTAYNLIMAGVSRTFSPSPDLIAIMDVGNDYENTVAAASVQTAMTTVLNSLVSATPSTTKIAVLQDFIAAAYPSNLQAAVTAVSNARVSYVATPSYFNTSYGADSLNLHPTASNAVGLIAPQIANVLQPIINPASNQPTFRRGFR